MQADQPGASADLGPAEPGGHSLQDSGGAVAAAPPGIGDRGQIVGIEGKLLVLGPDPVGLGLFAALLEPGDQLIATVEGSRVGHITRHAFPAVIHSIGLASSRGARAFPIARSLLGRRCRGNQASVAQQARRHVRCVVGYRGLCVAGVAEQGVDDVLTS